MTITLTVAGRIATVEADGHVVAGNTYPVTLSLDSEWTGSLYLRVRFGSLYYDIPFASSAASVDVQMPVGYPEVGIGVYSEALEICTNEARIRLLRSILEAGEQVVEFDSDLYDQWAGEVTTLLTDDAFDAESTRPVQNAVLTAWKDIVPLDSALVHRTGNETIAGNKTFQGEVINERATAVYAMKSTQADTTVSTFKGVLTVWDKKDGSDSNILTAIVQSGAQTESVITRLYKHDRSAYHQCEMRAFSDHLYLYAPPYLPTDSQGNPLAIDNRALVTSSNIAVDPRIVHTTGNETIAGNKALRGNLAIESSYPLVEMHCTSDVGTTGTKGAINFLEGGSSVGKSSLFAYQASNMRQMMLRHFRDGSGFADMGVVLTDTNLAWGEAPTYTADNSADNKIVTRSMLATTPTVVHTTGNEVVAGVKTLTGVSQCLSADVDMNNPPSYRTRGMNSLRVGTNGVQTASEDTVWFASAGNSRRVTVTAKDADGNDKTAVLMLTAFRDGTARLRFERPDGTFVDLVPKG